MRQSKDNLTFEVSFFEALVAQDENFVDALIPLGDTYTKLGEHEKGLQVDLKLSRLRPHDPSIHYNLACSFSLLGEIEAAYQALEKAVRLGYTDIKHMLQDTDMRNLVNDEKFPGFLELILEIAKKGSTEQKSQ
jgi:tetratricopeptide (TPR) repeat protein